MTVSIKAVTPQAVTALPGPVDRPEADVVIYDGDCRFCTSQVQRLARWDRGGRLAFLSLHDPEVAARWPDLTHDMLMEQMYVVDRAGQRHGGAEAFRYLTRRLPRLWILAPLLHVPFSLPLWKWGYRQVAKRRYQIAGKMKACDGDACAVHFK
jgi:predicted DCC family thiol-disulfide oxidoreductase YuxK